MHKIIEHLKSKNFSAKEIIFTKYYGLERHLQLGATVTDYRKIETTKPCKMYNKVKVYKY